MLWMSYSKESEAPSVTLRSHCHPPGWARNEVFKTFRMGHLQDAARTLWGEKLGRKGKTEGDECEGPPWSTLRLALNARGVTHRDLLYFVPFSALWIYLKSASCMNTLPIVCYLMLLWDTIDLSFEFSEGNLTLFKSGSLAIKAHILLTLTAPCC